MSVRTRILHGVGANVFGQCVNTVIQLVGLPLFLAVWGVTQYGEWLILSSLASFLSMSDIGFATAAGNDMTIRVGRGDHDRAVAVYQSMWTLLCVLGALVLVAWTLVVWLTPVTDWLPLRHTTHATSATVLTLLAVYVLAGQQIAVLQAGFRCDGHYALGQALGASTRLAEFCSQAFAACFYGTFESVAFAALCTRVVGFVVISLTLSKKSKWLPLGFSHADRSTIATLVHPALAFMGMPLGNALGNQGMLQSVAATLGPSAAVVFSTHRTVTNILIQLLTIIKEALRPEFSRAYGMNDVTLQIRMHRHACKTSFWISLVASMLLLASGPTILYYWTHGEVPTNRFLLTAFLASVVLRSLWMTSALVHTATNRHRRLAFLYAVGTGASCLSAYAIASHAGVLGAAMCLAANEALLAAFTIPSSLALLGDEWRSFRTSVVSLPTPHAVLRSLHIHNRDESHTQFNHTDIR